MCSSDLDTGRVAEHLADRWVADTVAGQLRAAEIVVLNKAEPGRSVASALDAIAAYRPGARIVETTFGAIDPVELRFEPPTRSRFRADAPAEHPFVTWSYVPTVPLDRGRLRAALAALPASVLRIKGFCRLGETAEPYLLQYAAGEWALTPCDGEPGLVVIGTPDMPSRAALTGLLGLVSVRGC